MTITEYFARMCAAGLAPDWDNIWALEVDNKTVYLADMDFIHCAIGHSHKATLIHDVSTTQREIQLRKDGVNLYQLEWRKPTEQDIGKMCWFYNEEPNIKGYNVTKDILKDLYNNCYYIGYWEDDKTYYDYCLLADHEQIIPTVEDFKKVYGE